MSLPPSPAGVSGLMQAWQTGKGKPAPHVALIIGGLCGPHDHDRAVGMSDDGVGDISHEGPLEPAEPSAAYHYQTSADIFGQVNDRLVPSLAHLEMSDSDGAARLLDLPHVFVKYLLGLAPEGLASCFGFCVLFIDGAWESASDDEDMEPRASTLGQVYRRERR